ncbi:hypothetical protein ABU05_001241 [Escherichia fergusonii]|nr:hypothetical protein [Escherichia fergusonii]
MGTRFNSTGGVVFPAPAGINRPLNMKKRWLQRVPRASGDKPFQKSTAQLIAPCSPRQRG